MGSKKGRVERLVYHGMIYLSRGRSTPKLVSGMGLTHTKGIRICNDWMNETDEKMNANDEKRVNEK